MSKDKGHRQETLKSGSRATRTEEEAEMSMILDELLDECGPKGHSRAATLVFVEAWNNDNVPEMRQQTQQP